MKALSRRMWSIQGEDGTFSWNQQIGRVSEQKAQRFPLGKRMRHDFVRFSFFCHWFRPLGFTESEFHVHLAVPGAVAHLNVQHGPVKKSLT